MRYRHCRFWVPILASLAGTACDGLLGPRAATTWHVEQAGYANVQPALDEAGGVVFTATGDGHVIARDLATGRQRWAARVGGSRLEAANLVARSGVVVAPVVFHTDGLDAATGAHLWRYRAPLDTVDGGEPLPGSLGGVHLDADAETVFVPAWGGSIAAVELRTGRVRWTWLPEAGIEHRFGAQGVRVSGDTVYATVWHFLDTHGATCEGWVVALDAATGRQIWRTTLPRRSTNVCLPGAPALAAGRVVALMLTGEMFGLDARDGRVVWQLARDASPRTGVFNAVLTSPVAAGDAVYADAGTETIRAVAAADGRILWTTRYSGQLKDDLLATESRLYGPDGLSLHVFNRSTGRVRTVLSNPGKKHNNGLFPATPAAAGGMIIAPVEGGVWAFPER